MFIIIPARIRLRLLIIAIIFALQSVFGENECPVPDIPNGKFEVLGHGYELGKPIPNFSIIRFTCNEGYSIVPSGNDTVDYCNSGSFNKVLPQCLQCGEVVEVNGTSEDSRSFPWYVGIYKKRSTDAIPTIVCAGSIISSNKVVSVAHCFTHELNGTLYPPEEYYVAAGKHYSGYDASEDNDNVQKRKVSHIAVASNYAGVSRNFRGDISVVTVDKPFEFSQFVKPVCIDWNSLYEGDQLKSNNHGQIVQFHSTERDDIGNIPLKKISVPYIDRSQCLTAVPELFVKYLTLDKFCAGYTDGTNIGGLSGAGIVFERKQLRGSNFFLRGVLSTGPQNGGKRDLSSYAAYTKVSAYLEFIHTEN